MQMHKLTIEIDVESIADQINEAIGGEKETPGGVIHYLDQNPNLPMIVDSVTEELIDFMIAGGYE